MSDDRFKIVDEGIVVVTGVPGGAALPMVPIVVPGTSAGTGTRLSLDLYRGDSRAWEFTFYDDLAKTMPSDLSEATPQAEIRYGSGGVSVLPLECEVMDPANVGDPQNKVSMRLLATAWDGFPVVYGLPAQWDLQLTYVSGNVATVVSGPVYITPDVTDSVTPGVTP